MKPRNKTLAVWLALLGGSLGLHRFYLRGWGDWIGWLHPIAAALGWMGVERVQQYGQDDHLSWVLIPFLGLSIANWSFLNFMLMAALAAVLLTARRA